MLNNSSVEFITESRVKLSGGQIIDQFHLTGTCLGEFCPVHNPSNHDLRNYPLIFTGVNMLRELPNGSLVPDPDDYYYNMGHSVIVKNMAKCYKCNTIVQSFNRHDFQECKCGNIFVDGGFDYTRHGFTEGEYYENISIICKKQNV